jgi:hypothetical protein
MPAGYLTGDAPAEPARLMTEFRRAIDLDEPECEYCHRRRRMPYRGCRTCGSIGCVSAMRAAEEAAR